MSKVEINQEVFNNFYNKLLGQVLTIVDVAVEEPIYFQNTSSGVTALYSGGSNEIPVQSGQYFSKNKAVKDLIRNAFKAEFADFEEETSK